MLRSFARMFALKAALLPSFPGGMKLKNEDWARDAGARLRIKRARWGTVLCQNAAANTPGRVAERESDVERCP